MCMSKKLPLQAFKFQYNGLAKQIITPVVIVPEHHFDDTKLKDILQDAKNLGLQFNALWDTGASCSCIKPDIAKKIGITENIVTFTQVTGVNSKTETKPVYKIGTIILPNRVRYDGFHLIESNIASIEADILIGMDLILSGDMSITNYGGKTTFCFSAPPHENEIDLVERSNRVNKRKK